MADRVLSHYEARRKVKPGDVFGHLTVLEYLKAGKHNRLLCLCACGSECRPFATAVYSGRAKSCGCAPRKNSVEREARAPRKSKVDLFLETGEAECRHHGVHRDWKFRQDKYKQRNGKVEVYRAVQCRICQREQTRRFTKANPGYQDRYRYTRKGGVLRLLSSVRKRCKDSGLPNELDYEWVVQQLERQGDCCAYTGRPFVFDAPGDDERLRHNMPSIDQFEAGKGYTKANSRLVGAGVNIMKYDIPFDEFVAICRDVAAKFPP